MDAILDNTIQYFLVSVVEDDRVINGQRNITSLRLSGWSQGLWGKGWKKEKDCFVSSVVRNNIC